MPRLTVADIEPQKKDQRGKTIEEVYSKVFGLFAVFLADGEVTVQYADDDTVGADQRKALSPIRPLRGEIDGLVRKLMQAPSIAGPEAGEEKRFYDRQVADALFMGLQGDIDMSRAQLEGVRALLRERLSSVGRMQVAKWTLISTLVMLVAFGIIVFVFWLVSGWLFGTTGAAGASGGTDPTGGGVMGFVVDTYLWAAVVFGALGACLSIAIGLRHREIEPSTSRLDNILDTVLRIIVAVLSATILFSLVHLGLFSVQIGNAQIGWSEVGKTGWNGIHVAIILGIVAGFSERLVGNLLSRAEIAERRAATATPAAQSTAANERNPTGKGGGGAGGDAASVAQLAAAAVAATQAQAQADSDETVDHCLCDHPAGDDEVTPDDALPVTAGGVATDDNPEDRR